MTLATVGNVRRREEIHVTDFGDVATEGLDDRLYGSQFPIHAHRMARVTANLMYFPAIQDGRDPLIADVIFTDNFENEHRVRSRFRSIRA